MALVDKVIDLLIVAIPVGIPCYFAYLKHKAAKTADEQKAAMEEIAKEIVLGVQKYKASKSEDEKKEINETIQSVTIPAGVEAQVQKFVKKTTQSIQIPKLLLLLPLVMMLGCVNAAVHNAAVKLQKDLATLNAATVPHPNYYDPSSAEFDLQAAEKVVELKKECLKTVDKIEEASR